VKHTLLIALPTALALTACATGPYGGGPNAGTRTVVGAAAGAAVGALAGSAVGAGALTGAGIGAVAGGAIGALVKGPVIHGRQYYKDTRGYCYYVDANGKTQYDGTVQC
jgi:uncharacterized protein YcfJ